MAVQVSPLVHIEIVVRDAEEAYTFLKRVFGSRKTQKEFAEFLTTPMGKVVHVDLGGTVLQFIEPHMEGNMWSEHLEKKGPGVHNLTFLVNDIKEAVRLLEAEGAPVLLEMPFDWTPLMAGDVKLRENYPPVYMVGSEEQVGFRLELSENPAEGDPPQWLTDPRSALYD